MQQKRSNEFGHLSEFNQLLLGFEDFRRVTAVIYCTVGGKTVRVGRKEHFHYKRRGTRVLLSSFYVNVFHFMLQKR